MLKKLIKIESLFNEAQELYESLPEKEKQNILNFHNEQYSIPYCLKWGIQAIEEINDDILQRLSGGETIKYGKHQIYYDKMHGEYIVERFEFFEDYKGINKPMYSIIDGFESFDEALQCISMLK